MRTEHLVIVGIILSALILSIWMTVRMGKIAHAGGETMSKREAVGYTILFALNATALIISSIMIFYMKRR